MEERLVDLEHGGEAAEMVLGKPPRLLRASIYLLVGMIAAGLIWAYCSHVDIVISAPGVVRPEGDVVKVQSVAAGRLLEVRAREGLQVKRGDLLFRIDGSEIQADLEKTIGREESARKQLESLQGSRATLLLQQRAEEERDRIETLAAGGELEKARRSRDQANAMLKEAESRLAEAKLDYERTKRLVEEDVLSQAELQKKESAWKTAQASREGAAASLSIAEQSVSLFDQNLALKRKQAEVLAGERKRTLADLDSRILSYQEEAHGLQLEVEKLRTTLGHLEIRAPASGTVTSLVHRAPGEVVRSGDPIATIASEGAPWIVEAYVSNRDAGPLQQKIGGRVKLKFDAFPFRDYGTMEGKLIEVSPDVSSHEKLGMVYRVKIGMDRLELRRGRREGRVALGMTVTAEIVKEEERILALLYREVRDRVSYE